jgi:hypothetical protein
MDSNLFGVFGPDDDEEKPKKNPSKVLEPNSNYIAFRKIQKRTLLKMEKHQKVMSLAT